MTVAVEISGTTANENVSDDDSVIVEGPASRTQKPVLKCEVQRWEERHNLKGEKVMKLVESKEDSEEKEDEPKHIMVSYKHYCQDGSLCSQRLEIFSSHIHEALRQTIKSYPGVTLNGTPIILHDQLQCVFHYRKELENYRQGLDDNSIDGRLAKLHIHKLMQFMQKENRKSIQSYKAHVETAPENPSIEFEDVWMAFKPGDLVVAGRFEQFQVCQLQSTKLKKSSSGLYWAVTGRFLTHDGTELGYVDKVFSIHAFSGVKVIRKMPVFPSKYYYGDGLEEFESLRRKLIARGKKFCSLEGHHHRAYKGIAYAISSELDYNGDWPFKFHEETVTVDSRIIVDSKTFSEFKSPNRIQLSDRKRGPANVANDKHSLSDDDYLICDYKIPGFSLFDKKWCWFSVDFIHSVEFDDTAFDRLLLPSKHKDLVYALAENHGSNDQFDDWIKGKGKGLVFVLYGEPGVGKTFTAESIADKTQRPLYILNSGELGVTPESVEANLNSALKLATKWSAVLLIDEADVFLEQRTVSDLTRNCLVSLFLRVLEYYNGILFLTTNRLTTFDVAFKSRIHLALKYSPLEHVRRKELWKLFIERCQLRDEPPLGWPESLWDELAQVDINGRQIKNTVRTANTLARSKKTKLGKEHIEAVLETMKELDEELKNEGDEEM